MQPKERPGRGGNKGQVKAGAKPMGIWRKAPVRDMWAQKLSLQVWKVELGPLFTQDLAPAPDQRQVFKGTGFP